VIEAHREVATSLRDGTKVGDVTEHFGERDDAIDLLGVAALGFPSHGATTATADIADDVAIVLLRNGDLDLHERLKDDRVAFGRRGL
jgi:hypothetical protein